MVLGSIKNLLEKREPFLSPYRVMGQQTRGFTCIGDSQAPPCQMPDQNFESLFRADKIATTAPSQLGRRGN